MFGDTPTSQKILRASKCFFLKGTFEATPPPTLEEKGSSEKRKKLQGN